MSSDISSALLRVRESSARLNLLCDQASLAVRNLEEYLQHCSVGIGTSVLVNSGGQAEGSEIHLRYQRYSNKFRICVTWTDKVDKHSMRQQLMIAAGTEATVVTKAWLECSREEKLLTLSHLGSLLLGIEAKINEQIQGAEASLKIIQPLAPEASMTTEGGAPNEK